MNEQELLDLKEDIDQAKQKHSELKGRKEFLMKQLKEDWSCTTVEQAEKASAKMEKEIETLNEQIKKGTEELQEKLETEDD